MCVTFQFCFVSFMLFGRYIQKYLSFMISLCILCFLYSIVYSKTTNMLALLYVLTYIDYICSQLDCLRNNTINQCQIFACGKNHRLVHCLFVSSWLKISICLYKCAHLRKCNWSCLLTDFLYQIADVLSFQILSWSHFPPSRFFLLLTPHT